MGWSATLLEMNTILRVLSHFDFHGKFGSERIHRNILGEEEEESEEQDGDESYPGGRSCSADCCDGDCECDDCLRCSEGMNEEDTLVFRAAAG